MQELLHLMAALLSLRMMPTAAKEEVWKWQLDAGASGGAAADATDGLALAIASWLSGGKGR